MTRRARTSHEAERRLAELETDVRQDQPGEVRGVTAEWVSYDTDAADTDDELAAEFVVVDGSAGE